MLTKNKLRIKYLFKGLLIAFIFTIVLLIFFSLLLRFTSLSESKLPSFNNITMIISIVFASIYSAIKIKENGWINGAIIGLLYYLVIIVINLLLIKNGESNIYYLSRLIISTVTGIIGGVIGINLS